MSTLYDWLQLEYERLLRQGQPGFVEQFEGFRKDFFAAEYHKALTEFSVLRQTASLLKQPKWIAIIDYFEAAAELYWRGNLAAALDHITSALLVFNKTSDIPTQYALELVMDIWLATDGPGYAPQVLQSLKDPALHTVGLDARARFALIRARALATLGQGEAAADLVNAQLNMLDWPEPYLISLRGESLLWQARYGEAAVQLELATAGFAELGMLAEHGNVQLTLAEAQAGQHQYDKALETLETTIASATKTVNQSNVGHALGQMGMVLRQMGNSRQAVASCQEALTHLDGLGWLRSEALYAMEILFAQVGGETVIDHTARLQAEKKVFRLLSTDLAEELERFTGEHNTN